MTNPGAQWTARPTNALRLCAFGQRLARGHPGRSAVEVGGACQGFLQPRGSRAVAAPVRARSTGFKPKDRVHTSNSGAQWTARPTLILRFCVFALKMRRIRPCVHTDSVAAPVRARTVGFRPRRRVCTEPTPARSGLRARPTLCAFAPLR